MTLSNQNYFFSWKSRVNIWEILDELIATVVLHTSGILSLVYPRVCLILCIFSKGKQVVHSCITHCCFCFHSKFGHPELSGSEFWSVEPCLLKSGLSLYFFHKADASYAQRALMCYKDSKYVFFLYVPFTEL